MIDLAVFVRGLLLGLAIAAPVGPIGVLCIRRTLNDGRLVGFVTGLGAATADGFYGGVAAFGLTAVTSLLTGFAFWLRAIGGGFLLYLGIRGMLTHPATESGKAPRPPSLWANYASTVGLTLSNPATIFAFLGIFAGLGLASGSGNGSVTALTLVSGVFIGSALWWLALSTGIGWLQGKVGPRTLRGINIGSGALIAGFGVVALVSLLWK